VGARWPDFGERKMKLFSVALGEYKATLYFTTTPYREEDGYYTVIFESPEGKARFNLGFDGKKCKFEELRVTGQIRDKELLRAKLESFGKQLDASEVARTRSEEALGELLLQFIPMWESLWLQGILI